MLTWNTNRVTFRPWLSEPLESLEPILKADISDFDNDGFQLTELEKEYYIKNEVELISSPTTYSEINFHNHWPLKQPWFRLDKHPNIFVNRAFTYTRYGMAGRARYELEKIQSHKPEVRRIMDIFPYWGFEIRIDWIDNTGVYELLNVYKKYDDPDLFKYDKRLMEDILNSVKDWELECRLLYSRKEEWQNLDFEERNTYKKRYFGINV